RRDNEAYPNLSAFDCHPGCRHILRLFSEPLRQPRDVCAMVSGSRAETLSLRGTPKACLTDKARMLSEWFCQRSRTREGAPKAWHPAKSAGPARWREEV